MTSSIAAKRRKTPRAANRERPDALAVGAQPIRPSADAICRRQTRSSCSWSTVQSMSATCSSPGRSSVVASAATASSFRAHRRRARSVARTIGLRIPGAGRHVVLKTGATAGDGDGYFMQPVGVRADAVVGVDLRRSDNVMHLSMQQMAPAASAAAAAWLMVRMGAVKGMVTLRAPSRCAACGRRRAGHGCRCTGSDQR